MDLLYVGQREGALFGRPLDNSEELLSKLETAGKVPSKDKFRCMVCWTMVCSGSCPYNDRCVFLHDPRIKINGIKLKPFKLTRTQQSPKDTLYWPDMQRTQIHRLLDRQGLPDANQMYIIPETFATSNPKLVAISLANKRSYFHDRAVYSLWAHFVDFCAKANLIPVPPALQLARLDPNKNASRNPFIPSMHRLPIFISLANDSSKMELSLDSIFSHHAITGKKEKCNLLAEIRMPSKAKAEAHDAHSRFLAFDDDFGLDLNSLSGYKDHDFYLEEDATIAQPSLIRNQLRPIDSLSSFHPSIPPAPTLMYSNVKVQSPIAKPASDDSVIQLARSFGDNRPKYDENHSSYSNTGLQSNVGINKSFGLSSAYFDNPPTAGNPKPASFYPSYASFLYK